MGFLLCLLTKLTISPGEKNFNPTVPIVPDTWSPKSPQGHWEWQWMEPPMLWGVGYITTVKVSREDTAPRWGLWFNMCSASWGGGPIIQTANSAPSGRQLSLPHSHTPAAGSFAGSPRGAPSWPPQTSSVHLLSPMWLFATPWTAAHLAFLSITQSLFKLMSMESVMQSNHLNLCQGRSQPQTRKNQKLCSF